MTSRFDPGNIGTVSPVRRNFGLALCDRLAFEVGVAWRRAERQTGALSCPALVIVCATRRTACTKFLSGAQGQSRGMSVFSKRDGDNRTQIVCPVQGRLMSAVAVAEDGKEFSRGDTVRNSKRLDRDGSPARTIPRGCDFDIVEERTTRGRNRSRPQCHQRS